MKYITSLERGNNQGFVNHTDKYHSYQPTLSKAQLLCIYIPLTLRQKSNNYMGKIKITAKRA